MCVCGGGRATCSSLLLVCRPSSSSIKMGGCTSRVQMWDGMPVVWVQGQARVYSSTHKYDVVCPQPPRPAGAVDRLMYTRGEGHAHCCTGGASCGGEYCKTTSRSGAPRFVSTHSGCKSCIAMAPVV